MNGSRFHSTSTHNAHKIELRTEITHAIIREGNVQKSNKKMAGNWIEWKNSEKIDIDIIYIYI